MLLSSDMRLAVLIDAENIPRKRTTAIMREIALYGTPTIKRIYGDWTSSHLAGWKSELLTHAITPIQQYSYTTGKNSSDSTLIIDAMDILYSGRTDGFCIVSSDSDFTRLAMRLREAGQKVIGFGEKKTPGAFIAACDKFIYIEILDNKQSSEAPETKPDAKASRSTPHAHAAAKTDEKDTDSPNTEDVVALISNSVSDLADDDGYAFLGDVGNLLLKKQPDFDPRNYGYSKLTALVRALGCFDIDIRQTSSPNIKHVYIKTK